MLAQKAPTPERRVTAENTPNGSGKSGMLKKTSDIGGNGCLTWNRKNTFEEPFLNDRRMT